MDHVASRARIADVNGPGRAALAEAVEWHRGQRWTSRKAMAEHISAATDGAEHLSDTTIKNVEKRLDQAVSTKTLRLLDLAFEWEPGTARAILRGHQDAPMPVTSAARRRSDLPANPRLRAELEGRQVLDVKAVDLSVPGARVIISLVGDEGMDMAAIREALLAMDALERDYRRD